MLVKTDMLTFYKKRIKYKYIKTRRIVMKKILLNGALTLLTFMAVSGANTFSVLGMHQPKKPECL